jgi:hypothetical protein
MLKVYLMSNMLAEMAQLTPSQAVLLNLQTWQKEARVLVAQQVLLPAC